MASYDIIPKKLSDHLPVRSDLGGRGKRVQIVGLLSSFVATAAREFIVGLMRGQCYVFAGLLSI